jgi:outer membrane protein OmpA-like peptidoglycan-associated protein
MLLPVGEPSGPRGVLVRLLLAAVCSWGGVSLARADMPPAGSAPPAAYGLVAAADSGSPSPKLRRLAEGPDESFGPEERAQELYLDAMEKLDAGRDAWAQKTFEALIAQFPQSSAAGLARRQLGALYRRGTAPGAAAAAAINPPPPAPPALAASAAAMTVGASPLWEQELQRNAAIQARLRGEAGDRVFFSPGSAQLGTRALAALTVQAQWLNRWHEFEAAIEGHADEPGSDEENMTLSHERAEAVRRQLVADGVDASRLAVVAQGRRARIAICSEADCLAQNRRAVTLVFASGTRERLGLAAPVSIPTLEEPHLPPPDPAAAIVPPAGAERVGVAR